jgi:hypothetical protein
LKPKQKDYGKQATTNTYSIQENSEKIAWQRVTSAFLRYGLKEESANGYRNNIRIFCNWARVQPFDFARLGLERVEDLTADFIAEKRGVLAPKYLNAIYCAIKRWCHIQRMMKSTRLFREIRFDKTSRKVDALTEMPIETRHVKTIFKIADLEDAIDAGLYALIGLRPRIIPQLVVRNVHGRNYEIDADGKFRFTVKPPIMIIPRTYMGNKGNITFMVFIPTKLAELIELQLNTKQPVTGATKISPSRDANALWYKMRKLLRHPAVNFKGRPYLLRSFADDINDHITLMFNDEDFKEFLMGHRSRMSAIYQLRGLTTEKEAKYRDMYVKACDEWINTNIFEVCNNQAFKSEKIDPSLLEAKLMELIERALDSRMLEQFERLYLRMEAKHNRR